MLHQAPRPETTGVRPAATTSTTPRVDFEWSGLDVWLSDLARLRLGIWASRPDLRDAFLRGYGREPDDTGHAILRGCAALTAVWLLVKAHQAGQASFEDASRTVLRRLIDGRH